MNFLKFFVFFSIFFSVSVAHADHQPYCGESNLSLAQQNECSAQHNQPEKTAPAATGQGDTTLSNSRDIQAVCGIGQPSSYFAGCMTSSFIYLGGLAMLGGGATFDFFLDLTTNTGYYSAPYIATTWATMRDLANITFILGIIAVALLMITGASGIPGIKSWQEIAKRLIIIALLLNFSLFFAQVVIDAGNITGSFFKEMVLKNAKEKTVIDPSELGLAGAEGIERSPSVSATIALAVDPVNLLKPATINKITENGQSQSFLFVFNIIYLLVSLLIAFQLFKSGFMFLSRTLGLVILMIISPLAFVAYFLPKGEHLFFKWLSNLFTKSFCICVFLFLLFMLIKVLEGTTSASFSNTGDGWLASVIYLSINVMITYSLLSMATNQTQKMCEGSLTGNLGSLLMKTTVGAGALVGGGTIGVGARATIGRLGYGLTKQGNDLAGSTSAGKRFVGNVALRAGRNFESAKFGTKAGYREQLDKQADATINTGENIYNIQKGKEINKLKDDVKAGTITQQEANKQAASTAKAAQKEYLEGISTNSLGGIADFVLAGAVASGAEAYKRFDKIESQESLSEYKQTNLAQVQKIVAQKATTEDKALKRTVDNLSRALGSLTKRANGTIPISQDADVQAKLDKFEESLAYTFQDRSITEGGTIDVKALSDGQQKQVKEITTQLENQLEEERKFFRAEIDIIEQAFESEKKNANGDVRIIQAATMVRDKAVDKENTDYQKRKESVLKDSMAYGSEQIKAWKDYEKQTIPAKLENIFEERNFAIAEFTDNLTQDVNPILTNQT